MPDTTNENNTPKRVAIPITIYTEFKDREYEPDYLRIQVEQANFHIQAITYFMKMAACGHSYLDLQTDTELLDLQDFCENVQLGCQLVEALIDATELPASRWRDAVRKECEEILSSGTKETESEASDEK